MDKFGNKSLGVQLTISIFVLLTFLACSDPIGFPADFRVYYNDDYSGLLRDSTYSQAVSVNGIQAIKQEISCGYAVIEMLAKWKGKPITEHSLSLQNNGKISTSMGSGFLKEMNRQFPEWETTRYVNITNGELLQNIHTSLKNGFPAPIEFAAKNTSSEWTLHFAIVTSMDLRNNQIIVQNPYGYEETYTVQNFIRATRYESYENMEWYFKTGFNMGLFNKNTLYIIANK
ncbi:MAG: hypothetical protein LBK02_01890 [Treponema sp.]|nr:hypothetical protein [Treponema sp.]